MTRAGLCAALVCGSLAFAGAPRAADDAANSSFELAVYVWGAGVYGDIDTPRGEVDNSTSFSDIYENLSGGLMARGRYEIGDFSIVSDVMYIDLETDRKQQTLRLGPRGNIDVRADAKAEMQTWIADLTAGYGIFNATDTLLEPRGELYAGARYFDFSPEIDVNVGAQSRTIQTDEAWVDAIIGARFALMLSPTVELSVQGDGGGFGIGHSSEFSWMQMTALSWHFAERARFHMGYKFLQFRRDTGDVSFRQQFRGPLVAVSFLF